METTKLDLSRRNFMLALAAVSQSGELLARGPQPAHHFENPLLEIALVGSGDCLWTYRIKKSGRECAGAKHRDHGEGADQAEVLEGIDGLSLDLRRRRSPEIMKHQRCCDRESDQYDHRRPCPDPEDKGERTAQFDHDRSCRQQTAKPALAARQTRRRQAECEDLSIQL